MEQPLQDEVLYYYDAHPTEEDLMGETSPHAQLVHYLMEVLTRLLREQTCAIYENLNFYQTSEEYEHPLVPDIALIRGVSKQAISSYQVGVYGPAPQLVFEFASPETWKRDLREKPGAYDSMGAEEYYAYDPNQTPLPLSRRRGRRLFGWQRDRLTGLFRELSPDRNGRLWSPFLQSYLVPDGRYLRFYDRFGNRRLTGEEAEKQRAEEEAQRAEAALERARLLAEKLRELGIDPDQLG